MSAYNKFLPATEAMNEGMNAGSDTWKIILATNLANTDTTITAEVANGNGYTTGGNTAITKTSNAQPQTNSGGWLGPNIRRKTRKESYKERENLRLKIQDVEKVAEEIVNISDIPAKTVDTTKIIAHNRPDVADLVSKLMLELRVSVKSPDYTRAIQAALEVKKLKEAKRLKALQDDEDILMLLMS